MSKLNSRLDFKLIWVWAYVSVSSFVFRFNCDLEIDDMLKRKLFFVMIVSIEIPNICSIDQNGSALNTHLIIFRGFVRLEEFIFQDQN